MLRPIGRRPAEDGVAQVTPGAALDEEPCDILMSVPRRLMQRRRMGVDTFRVVAARILSRVEQEPDDVAMAVLRGISERQVTLGRARAGQPLARLRRHAQGRGDGQREVRTAAQERSRRLHLAMGESRLEGARRIGAMAAEELDEAILQPGFARDTAGRNQSQRLVESRSIVAASRGEDDSGNGDGVGRQSPPPHRVFGDEGEEIRVAEVIAAFEPHSLPRHVGMRGQMRDKPGLVAGIHQRDGPTEILVLDPFMMWELGLRVGPLEMRLEARPACEAIFPSDGEQDVAPLQDCGCDGRIPGPPKTRQELAKTLQGRGVAGLMVAQQAPGIVPGRLDREMGAQGLGGHTNLLRLSPAIRMPQAGEFVLSLRLLWLGGSHPVRGPEAPQRAAPGFARKRRADKHGAVSTPGAAHVIEARMTGLSALLRPDQGQPAIPLRLVDSKGFDAWMKGQSDRVRQAVTAQGFRGEGAQLAILPGDRADGWSALLGVADVGKLSQWCLARAAESLPEGVYRVEKGSPGPAALGWLLGQYAFEKYRKPKEKKGPRILLTDAPARIEEFILLAESTNLVRDLVNIPAGDLGPAELEAAVRDVAEECGAAVTVTAGEALDAGYPMIAAVGRAAIASRAPRLIEVEWGDQRHPRLAVIGKGVCFDSGGLDIKPSSGMRLMKKDMGGAAHALALARLIMKARLPVRLHLLIPAVENAISGAAFRPGDILKSRKGLTVEIGNTDAEGRLILGDALTRAAEADPELILDFATLTGAARVALGPDLPALFSSDDALAKALTDAGEEVADPLWRMPLWTAYEEMLASDVADIGNASDAPLAGAVTAALFLRKFVPEGVPWAHLDTFAWRPAAKPGRPKGGDALGLRAAWSVLASRYVR
ncbi:MAG: leucyl aminopeptidase family protein [Alphaproteobacteria bacterium]|nr:leucyl aminopeptidase family protein [Alphaproteobacteria bacterium]